MWKIIMNQIKNLINSKLFLYILLGGLTYFWVTDRNNLRNRIEILNNNQVSLIAQSSRELGLLRSDFKRYYHKEDSIASLIGIKSKEIHQVIVNNYHYKDSTTIIVPLKKDSIYTTNDTLKFIAPLGCMEVTGNVIKSKDIIEFKDRKFNDKLHTFLYQSYDHRFLGFLWKVGKYMNVKTYSECLKDTVSIERNIKIINNK